MNAVDYAKRAISLAREGKLAEAIDWFRQALLLSPTDPDAHYNLGNALKNHGQFFQAEASYREALRLRPTYVNAHNNLGIVYKEMGKLVEARDCYTQALRIDPHHANALTNLGNVLNQQGKRQEAKIAYQEALRLEPNRSDILYNLGNCLHEQGDQDQAVACYRQALRGQPHYPDASNNLGKVFKDQGLLDEACAQFRHTLKLQRNHALALYNLSELAAAGHYRFSFEEIEGVKAVLTSGICSPLERSLYNFTLAAVHHQQGSYDLAFGHYKQANDQKHVMLKERGQVFDLRKHQAQIERVRKTYDQAYFQRVKSWGLDTSVPVFIIGMPRSGSTLVEQILASHPEVFGAGEVGQITNFAAPAAIPNDSDLYSVPFLSNQHAALELATNYLQSMTRIAPRAARIINKSLDNFLHLGMIATLFPKARIIHCRREPRDLCLSCYFQNFQDVNYACSLEDIGAYYGSYEKLMAHWGRVLPLPIHEVHYEDLVHDQEKVTRALLDFCGLGWDEHCLTFFNTRRVVRTASNVQVRKPISARALGRWKHYRSHLDPLFKALGGQSVQSALPPQDQWTGMGENVTTAGG